MKKTYGRIAYETYIKELTGTGYNWVFLEQSGKDAWEVTAEAVIEEYEHRKPDEDDETTTKKLI